MSDLRAAVEAQLPPEPSYKDDSHGEGYLWHGRMIGRREVLALIPEGAVLVTEQDIEDALHWYEREGWLDGNRSNEYRAAAILRHLREVTE